MALRQPLYGLLIANDNRMWKSVVFGEKTISIREGHRDYRPGPVMLCCHLLVGAVMADITDVRHCTAAEVTAQECADNGFASREDMIAGMRRFYPSFAADSPVTVIRWKDVRGTMVDKKEEFFSEFA